VKYLNLGCGYHYSSQNEWANLDFTSTGEGVIAHNLLSGIPFSDNCFDLVYHSHVLEHFAKEDGRRMLAECFRVLKPGGILRIAVPDLEIIARNYLYYLEQGVQHPDDQLLQANYEWMLLEMYDQTVRNTSGGDMAKYLFRPEIMNEEFVYSRIGEEGKNIRRTWLSSHTNEDTNNLLPLKKNTFYHQIRKVKEALKQVINHSSKPVDRFSAIGKFRLGGEVHQWMYDRYSLSLLLNQMGGTAITKRDAFTSYCNGWESFGLDSTDGVVRKPDSLFMEALKK